MCISIFSFTWLHVKSKLCVFNLKKSKCFKVKKAHNFNLWFPFQKWGSQLAWNHYLYASLSISFVSSCLGVGGSKTSSSFATVSPSSLSESDSSSLPTSSATGSASTKNVNVRVYCESFIFWLRGHAGTWLRTKIRF